MHVMVCKFKDAPMNKLQPNFVTRSAFMWNEDRYTLPYTVKKCLELQASVFRLSYYKIWVLIET